MPAVIEVQNLHKTYGDTVAVDDVSFTVHEGEIFGILGPNGAGKTTTVECIEGLWAPDSGQISVLGRQAVRRPEAAALDRAGPSRVAPGSGPRRAHHRPGPAGPADTWELIEGVRDRGVTIVLVTHFMEEAERLCDRVALIDAGHVVAIDTPAGLAGRVEGGQRIQFRPSVPFDDALLTRLPDVTHVIHRGDVVVVTGNDNALNAVTSVLARNQIVAHQLRVDQASLEDAFLALTGRHPERSDSE